MVLPRPTSSARMQHVDQRIDGGATDDRVDLVGIRVDTGLALGRRIALPVIWPADPHKLFGEKATIEWMEVHQTALGRAEAKRDGRRSLPSVAAFALFWASIMGSWAGGVVHPAYSRSEPGQRRSAGAGRLTGPLTRSVFDRYHIV